MPIGPSSSRVLPAVDTTGALRQAGLLVCAMLVAGIFSAFVLKQDVNWDLQNYHFYNAWAFVHQRLGWDIANMLTNPIELCRLERSGGAGEAAPRSSLAPRAKG